MGYRGGSVLKIIYCPSRDLGFDSQHLRDGSSLPIFWFLQELHAHGTHTNTQAENLPPKINIIKFTIPAKLDWILMSPR